MLTYQFIPLSNPFQPPGITGVKLQKMGQSDPCRKEGKKVRAFSTGSYMDLEKNI